MNTFGLALLSMFMLVVVVGGVIVVSNFGRYCTEVARLQGRSVERRAVWGADENVMNSFQREQYRKLLTGEYKALGDERLVRMADRLVISLRASQLAVVGLIVCIAVFFVKW